MSDEPKPLKLISEGTMQRIRAKEGRFDHIHRALVATIDHDRKSAKEVIDLLMARIAVQKNRADHWEGLANATLPESVAMHQRVIGAWTKEVFPNRTRESILKHLGEEVAELLASGDPEEAADCYHILLDYCAFTGIDLMSEYEKKLQINLKRKWYQDADGVMRHIKGEGQ